MNKPLKIAIPTDDGSIVRKSFRNSRGFLVATVKCGKITHQDMRWNLLSEMMTSEEGYYYNLCDCDIVMVSDIGLAQVQILKSKNILIVKTAESEIPKALLKYLQCLPVLLEE